MEQSFLDLVDELIPHSFKRKPAPGFSLRLRDCHADSGFHPIKKRREFEGGAGSEQETTRQ